MLGCPHLQVNPWSPSGCELLCFAPQYEGTFCDADTLLAASGGIRPSTSLSASRPPLDLLMKSLHLSFKDFIFSCSRSISRSCGSPGAADDLRPLLLAARSKVICSYDEGPCWSPPAPSPCDRSAPSSLLSS